MFLLRERIFFACSLFFLMSVYISNMHIWVIFVISYVGVVDINQKQSRYDVDANEVWEGDVAGCLGFGWSPSYEAKGTRAYTETDINI